MRRSMEQPYLPRSSLPRCSRSDAFRMLPGQNTCPVLSQASAGKGLPFTVRSSRDRAESTAEAEEKAPSKSDQIKGYASPVSNPASYGAWQSRSVTGSACSIKSRIVLFYFGCFHPLGSRYQRDSSFQIPSVIMAVPLCG